jgi:tRNA-modifying protein YgfZ
VTASETDALQAGCATHAGEREARGSEREAPGNERETLRAQYEALQAGCGLLDRSGRGKLALTGPGAVEFLNGQITNELADLRPGEGRYAAFLTNKGKMLGDLRVLAAGTDAAGGGEDSQGTGIAELLLDTERVALQALFDMIRRYKVGYDVALHKRTLESSLLSLIGPAARACASRAAGHANVDSLHAEHAHIPATVDGGRRVRLIATSDGIDVLCVSPDRDAVWTALLDAGASAVGEDAAEILRVERGRPRYGIDMDDGTIPQEAALNERAVSFTKGCYVGQETVARLFYRGKPNRHLRGLRISEQTNPATPHKATLGEELRLGERVVGRLGSVVESPVHGAIALALVRREAGPGDTLAVGERGASATVVELPFAQVP